MKPLHNTYTINGWKEEIHTSYDFLEELEAILRFHRFTIGTNKFRGVEFIINNNGGELNLVIPNFMNVHHNIAFEINNSDFFKYAEYAESQVNKMIEKLVKVSDFLKTWEV